ncbi:MAG: hypothetical protein H7X70_05410 [Candidatus Kapabacteria bacterium]|nr:hypothetical protein [Candidatus Kapabacteria bacterium]
MSENTLVKRQSTAIRSAQNTAAWIDRTGWSWIDVFGTDRVDLLHRLTTNDLTQLKPGQGKQTVLLTDKARIIDVLTVLEDKEQAYILSSPGMSTHTIQWLRKYVIMDDVKLLDRSNDVRMVEICGPRAALYVNQLLGTEVSALALCQWQQCPYAEGQITVVRMPSPSEVSYWLVGATATMDTFIDELQNNDEQLPGLTPSEAEYLRVIAGMGAIGHEWLELYNPLEAGLLHLTSFTKGCYIGQEVVARLDSYNKVKQRLMGITSQELIAQGNEVVANDVVIGIVTSAVPSCDGASTLALAYVRGEHAHPNTTISIRTETTVINVEQSITPLTDSSCQ